MTLFSTGCGGTEEVRFGYSSQQSGVRCIETRCKWNGLYGGTRRLDNDSYRNNKHVLLHWWLFRNTELYAILRTIWHLDIDACAYKDYSNKTSGW